MKLLASTLLIFLITAGLSQELMYTISWKDDSIGYLKAEREQVLDNEYYNINSNTEFRVLFSFNLNYQYENEYRKGRLYSASAKNSLNQKDRDQSTIIWQNDHYLLSVNDKIDKLKEQDIWFTVSKLFFNEPRGVDTIFSERFGKFLKLEKLEQGKYVLTKPDGRKNTYIYDKGICRKVIVDNPIITIHFTLLDE